MHVILSSPELLPVFLSAPKKLSGSDNVTTALFYAGKVLAQIIGGESLSVLEKLGIDCFDTLFVGKKPMTLFFKKALPSEISTLRLLLLMNFIVRGKKIYIIRINANKKGRYDFSQPEQVILDVSDTTMDVPQLKSIVKRMGKSNKKVSSDFFIYQKHVKKISSSLFYTNRELFRNVILSARKEYGFVIHYINEKCCRGIVIQDGRTLRKEEIAETYRSEHFVKVLNLSAMNDRNAFIALYAATFLGVQLWDIYSVDGIFSFTSDSRKLDEQLTLAGKEVFTLLFNCDRKEIFSVTAKMGAVIETLYQTLQQTHPNFTIDIDDFIAVKQNYSLYRGLSDIGKMYSAQILPETISSEIIGQKAKKLSKLSILDDLFSSVLENEHYEQTAVYFRAKDLQKEFQS
ncbi:hypothetical protein FACS189499_06870 [Clostridia bacterium]|nr:hypothetical protein FACS189499_06870 [Clostridia bacterium]